MGERPDPGGGLAPFGMPRPGADMEGILGEAGFDGVEIASFRADDTVA